MGRCGWLIPLALLTGPIPGQTVDDLWHGIGHSAEPRLLGAGVLPESITVFSHDLEFMADGTPLLAVSASWAPTREAFHTPRLFLLRFEGDVWGGWRGGPPEAGMLPREFEAHALPRQIELQLDREGNPWIAWARWDSELYSPPGTDERDGEIFALRWDGAAWAETYPTVEGDGRITHSSAENGDPKFFFAPDRTLLAYTEWRGPTGTYGGSEDAPQIFLRALTEEGWQPAAPGSAGLLGLTGNRPGDLSSHDTGTHLIEMTDDGELFLAHTNETGTHSLRISGETIAPWIANIASLEAELGVLHVDDVAVQSGAELRLLVDTANDEPNARRILTCDGTTCESLLPRARFQDRIRPRVLFDAEGQPIIIGLTSGASLAALRFAQGEWKPLRGETADSVIDPLFGWVFFDKLGGVRLDSNGALHAYPRVTYGEGLIQLLARSVPNPGSQEQSTDSVSLGQSSDTVGGVEQNPNQLITSRMALSEDGTPMILSLHTGRLLTVRVPSGELWVTAAQVTNPQPGTSLGDFILASDFNRRGEIALTYPSILPPILPPSVVLVTPGTGDVIGIPSTGLPQSVQAARIAVNSDASQVIVAYRGQDPDSWHLHRWSGDEWGLLPPSPHPVRVFALDIDESGIAWLVGFDPEAEVLRVMRWNGSAWNDPPNEMLETIDDLRSPYAQDAVLEFGADGTPVLGLRSAGGLLDVFIWEESGWSRLPVPSSSGWGAGPPALAIASSGQPVVAWAENALVRLNEFFDLSSQQVRVAHWNGSEWHPLGSDAFETPGVNGTWLPAAGVQIACDEADRLFLSWRQGPLATMLLSAERWPHGSGDFSGDGITGIADLVRLQNYLNGRGGELTPAQMAVIDLDGNGTLNAADSDFLLDILLRRF